MLCKFSTSFSLKFLIFIAGIASLFFCFVVGNSVDTSFEVTEGEKTTISRLKEIIFGKNQKCFGDIDANTLRLWRVVDIPWNNDVELGKLELLLGTRSPNEDTIILKEFGGKLLYPNKDIGDIFSQDSKDIRIIVQPPSSPATTVGSIFIPMKRSGEYQTSNREPVDRLIKKLCPYNVQIIILKYPGHVDLEQCSKYMKVEGNQIFLDTNMLNSHI